MFSVVAKFCMMISPKMAPKPSSKHNMENIKTLIVKIELS